MTMMTIIDVPTVIVNLILRRPMILVGLVADRIVSQAVEEGATGNENIIES